jgi:hypothetical protein
MAKEEVRSAEPDEETAPWGGLSVCPCATGDTITGAAAAGGAFNGESVGPLGRFFGAIVGEGAGGVPFFGVRGDAVACVGDLLKDRKDKTFD